MASAANTVIPIIRATLPRDRASGERPAFGAAVLPGWERTATCASLGILRPLLDGQDRDGEVSDSPAASGGQLTVARPCWIPTSFRQPSRTSDATWAVQSRQPRRAPRRAGPGGHARRLAGNCGIGWASPG